MQIRSRRFRLRFISLLGAIWLLMPIGEALAEPDTNWRSVRDSAPTGLIKQINQDYAADSNTDHPVDVGQMHLMLVKQPGAKSLYLINTRLLGQTPEGNPTCGQGGCLFYGYMWKGSQYVQVLNGYINDFRLQDAPPVIQPTKQVVNQLPCLQLTFYQNQSNQLLRAKLCFDGNEYQPTAPPVVLK